ncbi:MAG: TonB-dependent receptor [Bacteroidales bacterium]
MANNATTLRISFIGMKTIDVQIGEQKEIKVELEMESTTLDEVVVGYGSVRKSDLTGAVSSVKGKELTLMPVMRADQALQGHAAGVAISNNDGAPGGSTTIRIRGGNSITGGNNALIVIDGFQGGDLSSINPNEIASIEVLKDASATAIYGSRGANGVILVTTKSGRKGAPVIDYTYNFGIQNLAHKIDIMNAGDYARKSNAFKATQNINNPNPILPFTDEQIAEIDKKGGTDWQDEIYRSANLQMHQLSVTGGSDAVKYFVSGGYFDQQGLIINTNFKRITVRSNIDVDINKWFKAGVNVNLIKDKGNVPAFGEGTRYVDILGQVVNAVLRFDPITPVYDENGNYSKAPTTYGDKDAWNPVATAMGSYNESNIMTSNLNSFLEFRIREGFTFRVTGAAGIVNSDKRTYYNRITRSGSQNNGVGQLTDDKYRFFQNSNILTYDKSFDKHRLTLTGVAEQQVVSSYGSFIDAQGFFSDETGINDLGGASQINSKSSYDNKRAINSFLGRANYSFNNKYLFTVSYRADGASVFGANNKWGYFPSLSLAWKASEEQFVKDLGVFSDLKLRGSWGKTGNQAIDPYGSLDAIGSGYNYPYNGTGSTDIGYAMTRAANPNLKWESTAQTNLGLDLGLFGGRLTASIDLYKKNTENLLLNRPVPSYTGFSVLLDNVGSLENKGLELTLGGTPLKGDFTWNTSANISFNRSEVTQLLNDMPMAIKTNTGGGYNIYSSSFSLMYLQVGQPMGQMRGYVNEGTWSESEREEAAKYAQLPGDPKWKDLNGDGVITRGNGAPFESGGTGDIAVIGNSSPDFVYGWNNNLSYKAFSLSILFQGSHGNDIFNATRIKTEDPSIGASPALNDRWTPENQNTDVPAFIDQVTRRDAQLGPAKVKIGNDNRSSRWVEDGSYFRLKNLTFGYNLPSSLIEKINITSLRVFVTGTNVFTLTKYSGYDPEVSSFNIGTDSGRGIDISNYPTVKTVTFGINVTL